MSLTDSTRGARTRNGGRVLFEGAEFLRITGFDRMPPFLMSIPSDTDLWMFVSSAHGLTAGRVDADGALFPYVTVDQLHDAHHTTGPITRLRVRRGHAAAEAWRPFAPEGADDPAIERHLYKHALGHQLVFEEVHRRLGLAFRYRWAAADALGHVRTATIENLAAGAVAVDVIDGLRHVLPFGAPLALYQHSSSLVDAYKRAEVDASTGLAIFSLTSRISDRAEAAEELRANVVWSHGLDEAVVTLAPEAVEAFARGEAIVPERLRTGTRGHYYVTSTVTLPPGDVARWHLVADAGRSQGAIADLRAHWLRRRDLDTAIEAALAEATENLRRNVASADGLQQTGDAETSVHHLANVLFNNLRGGVFAKHHQVPSADFTDFARTRNRAVAERDAAWFAALPAESPVTELIARAAQTGDADLERLAHEYLPIHFGRRHGDPSRPWNRFAIRVREADGSRALRYEGNWRDIFQNWEALALAFPAFLPGIVAKFVNASTVDGFNPYRVTRDGIDWEVEEPGHPWSNIGYWGDHQVIYLLKLLEALHRTSPGALDAMLARRVFAYAQVPYRLAPYEAMLAHPRETITFDHELAVAIAEREASLGTDARLVHGPDGAVWHVTLFEKLLVTTLARLSNFVPGAGIWMNTQRPEWNDANNALVGPGVSVVTLAYLRRSLVFLLERFASQPGGAIEVSNEVARWAAEIAAALATHAPESHAGALGEQERRAVLDALGGAFSRYREAVYARGFSGRTSLAVDDVRAMLRDALAHVDRALRANEREDGLYHAYNLMDVSASGGLAIHRLPEMLEGQVAALSSGIVAPHEAVRLLDRLFASRMYRADQGSFMLYPERSLPAFLDRNVVPEMPASKVPLVGALLIAGEGSVLARDADGVLRFAADFRNASDLDAALEKLAGDPRWSEAVARDRAAVRELYESTFHHRSYLGRSGRMVAYEGIGCIYWHMVAKLLLAVQEVHARAVREGAPAAVCEALARHYERVRGGLGFEKSAEVYGAFPTDPYSHTPRQAGAQQPGMTGQVKEEILTRFGELGVEVEDGVLAFRPRLLRVTELLAEPSVLHAYDHDGSAIAVPVPAGGLAFTLAQVPVVYERTEGEARVRVTRRDGTTDARAGDALGRDDSRAVLERTGEVVRIDVSVPAQRLRGN